jgi:hypothetical protein
MRTSFVEEGSLTAIVASESDREQSVGNPPY